MSANAKHHRPASFGTWAARVVLAFALIVVAVYRLEPHRAAMGAVHRPHARVSPYMKPPAPTPPSSAGSAPKPRIVWKPIPFGAKRRAQTAAYARLHYGINTWRIQGPHVIVEHYTATNSFSSVFNYFASDAPDPELHSLPGICAQFVIDRNGTIYQLVAATTICRHTVGLNYTAIGIEHVGTSDAQVLHDRAQLAASIRLTVWLMQTYGIELRNVIGHNESLTSPYHKELVAAWRCQTHADWRHADMVVYRHDVGAYARRYGVPLGPPARPVKPNC